MAHAVEALYSGDPSRAAQANQWLTAFQASPAAWAVPFALLRGGAAPELQFFALALLVRKVRSADWARLEAGARQELAQTVRWAGERAGRGRRGSRAAPFPSPCATPGREPG